MKVSLNWLKDYLNLDNISKEELYNAISLHVCEIETMKPLCEVNNLVVGEVLTCVDHPDSDHLHVCEVNLGDKVSTIVCGAPNVAAKQKVIVALPGAKLPGGTIKSSKVRGVLSDGMICSLSELGIEDRLVDEKYKNGIYVLPEDTEVGIDAVKYLGLDDEVIDLELTSNRSDLLSVEGVAYDLAATLGIDINIPKYLVKETRMLNPLKVEIESDLCYEYGARLIKGITIKESPMWLKMRLISAGVRPINNVVDITNYVMLALGEPMHAYDHNFVGNHIVVKEAKDVKEFVTLDNINRKLEPNDLLITDGNKPIGLAGIMGGLNSEVLPTTTEIVLEAAMFDAMAIRRTSSRLGLKSEASTRFERIACQERIRQALDMASYLICQLAGGIVVGNMLDVVRIPYEKKYVDVTLNKVNNLLGTALTAKELETIFNNLRYNYEIKDSTYHIEIPSRRMDLENFYADICEDVARMIGYDKIPTTTSLINSLGHLTKEQQITRNIREVLALSGLNEVVTYSLVSEENLNLYNLKEEEPIKLLMPLTSDRAYMRLSLLNGIMEVINYNLARQMTDISIFEIGKRYNIHNEELMLAGGLTGNFSNNLWQGQNIKVDFYLVKGILDNLANKLNIRFDYVPYEEIKETYHPGRQAKILVENEEVGFIASIHPEFRLKHDLKDTYVFEISLDKLFKYVKDVKYETTSKYPSIERDLAIVIDEKVSADEVLKVVKMVAKKYLVSINIFDLYKDKSLGENKKSLAFKMVFVDKEKTLDSKDVDKVINSILNRLDYYFKAELR